MEHSTSATSSAERELVPRSVRIDRIQEKQAAHEANG